MSRTVYYIDELGVIHAVEFCEHCNKQIEHTHRCGDNVYCSTKCALEVLKEEMKAWKPKKIREIRMIHL